MSKSVEKQTPPAEATRKQQPKPIRYAEPWNVLNAEVEEVEGTVTVTRTFAMRASATNTERVGVLVRVLVQTFDDQGAPQGMAQTIEYLPRHKLTKVGNQYQLAQATR